MSSRQMNDIEVLSERLRSLQIMNEVLKETTEQLDKEISVAPVSATMNTNKQTIIPKSMVSDPR